MATTKEEFLKIGPEKILDWEVEKLEEGLKAIEVLIDKPWSKSKKANELKNIATKGIYKSIEDVVPKYRSECVNVTGSTSFK